MGNVFHIIFQCSEGAIQRSWRHSVHVSLLCREKSSMPIQSIALLMEMMQYDRKERIASPKSNPGVTHLMAARICWRSISRKLTRIKVLGSLPLSIRPQRFPAGKPVFSACLAATCGFVKGDSGQESGVVAPGRCRHCYVRDWPGAK